MKYWNFDYKTERGPMLYVSVEEDRDEITDFQIFVTAEDRDNDELPITEYLVDEVIYEIAGEIEREAAALKVSQYDGMDIMTAAKDREERK